MGKIDDSIVVQYAASVHGLALASVCRATY